MSVESQMPELDWAGFFAPPPPPYKTGSQNNTPYKLGLIFCYFLINLSEESTTNVSGSSYQAELTRDPDIGRVKSDKEDSEYESDSERNEFSNSDVLTCTCR